MKKKKKRKKNNVKRRNKVLKVILTIGGMIGSVFGVLLPMIEFYRDGKALEPHFTLEKNEDEGGVLEWKICNSGGTISNAVIYPTINVTFGFYDEQRDGNIELTIELLNYYIMQNYYYSTSDGSFYVKDEKQSEVNEFIETYANMFVSERMKYPMYHSVSPYFTLNYNDYKGNKCVKTYTISNDSIEENSERKKFGYSFTQLKEVSKIAKPDIIAPVKFKQRCVISLNYENAETQQIVENEQEYNDYLQAVFLDLIQSKDKPVEEMYGMAILSDGNLWVRDHETGDLIFVADNVEDFGFGE